MMKPNVMQGMNRQNKQPQKMPMINPFMPGQKGLLADQLNAGYGGSEQKWKGLLGQYYQPMSQPAPFEYGTATMGNKGMNDKTKEYLTPYIAMGGMPQMSSNPELMKGFEGLTDQEKNYVIRQWGGGGTPGQLGGNPFLGGR